MLVIMPAAKDNIQQIIFSDTRFNSKTETNPPSPILSIPAITLKTITRTEITPSQSVSLY
jgi:hypothetical protein